MAFGMSGSSTGGVMGFPSVPGEGQDQWAQLSGASPANPLVGGYAGGAGYGTGQRKIATSPNPTAAIASGNPSFSHWSQLFDLKNNPIGWVLLLLLGYVAMTHLQIAKKLPRFTK